MGLDLVFKKSKVMIKNYFFFQLKNSQFLCSHGFVLFFFKMLIYFLPDALFAILKSILEKLLFFGPYLYFCQPFLDVNYDLLLSIKKIDLELN